MPAHQNLVHAIVAQMADDNAPAVNVEVYVRTAESIRHLYGEDAHTRFANNVDATDDEFYLTISAEDFFAGLT
jgi:hypothetical protein